jgi:flagellar motility protein MotE (MotC chaperone)
MWRGKQIWPVGFWLAVIMALCWTMVQLNHDSSAQTTALPGSRPALPAAVDSVDSSLRAVLPEQAKTTGSESASLPPALAQGPALYVPEEVVAMLQQRQEDLERREKTVRTAEERLTLLKTEIEQILSKVEAVEQRRLRVKEEQQKKATGQSAAQKKEAYAQLTKMYESMPAEEAAARIERMPDRKALEILRLVKGKTAGSILAQVKVDRAAKLTEQLLSNP